MPPYTLAEPAVATFVVLPVVLVVLLAWATAVAWRRSGATAGAARRAAAIVTVGAAAWMAATWVVAGRGLLLDFTRTPPPFALLVAGIALLAILIAFGPLGSRLARYVPLWALVAAQAFRFPLEIAMHRLSGRGIMPVQMTYTGRNFDIATGITAGIVAWLAASGRGGRALVAVWNVMGFALLANVVIVAILSTPRFLAFGPDRVNVFVMHTPFVWLPAVMVLAALAGHLVVFRAIKVRHEEQGFRTSARGNQEGRTR